MLGLVPCNKNCRLMSVVGSTPLWLVLLPEDEEAVVWLLLQLCRSRTLLL